MIIWPWWYPVRYGFATIHGATSYDPKTKKADYCTPVTFLRRGKHSPGGFLKRWTVNFYLTIAEIYINRDIFERTGL